MKTNLLALAALVNGSVLGDENVEISGVTNIQEAGPADITFAVPPHLEAAAASRAAAVVIPDTVASFPKPAIQVKNPRMAFALLLRHFTPQMEVVREIHPSAVIGQNVKIGADAAIMPCAVIEDGAVIGDRAVIFPHCYIGRNARVGDDSLLYPNVTLREDCHVGSRVIIHSGAVIGSDGFGFVPAEGGHQKVPQVGNVVVEDDVELGANVAIDRATTGSTIIKRGAKIDNLVHVAHNVIIGENCFLVAQTGISGSVTVGNNVTFAGQTGCAGHLTIGDNCTFAARAAVISDVPANSFYAGFPARPHREWIKAEGIVHKLPDLVKKLRDMERRLAALEKSQD